MISVNNESRNQVPLEHPKLSLKDPGQFSLAKIVNLSRTSKKYFFELLFLLIFNRTKEKT